MPEGMTGAPGAASPPQMGGATPPPGQPAGGAGGATMPTPNRGLEAAALAKLAVAVQQISLIGGLLPAGSDAARDIRDALNKLAKHVPPGAISQGVQMTEAQRALMQQRQNQPQIAAQRAAQPAMQPQQQQQPSPPPPMAA